MSDYGASHIETLENEQRKLSRNSNGHNFSHGCPIRAHNMSRGSKLNNWSLTLLCRQRSLASSTNEQIHSGVTENLFTCRLDFSSLQNAHYGLQGSFHTSWLSDTRQKSTGLPRLPLLSWPHQADPQREFPGPHAYQANCFLSLFSLRSTSSIKSILKSTSVHGP